MTIHNYKLQIINYGVVRAEGLECTKERPPCVKGAGICEVRANDWGIVTAVRFRIGLLMNEYLPHNPSERNQRFRPPPFTQGRLWRGAMLHTGGFGGTGNPSPTIWVGAVKNMCHSEGAKRPWESPGRYCDIEHFTGRLPRRCAHRLAMTTKIVNCQL